MAKPKPDLCNQPDTTVIDPNDILFVVKENKSNEICNECELIRGSESNTSSNKICLDLSDFRTINGRTLTNADILKTLDSVCCKQKVCIKLISNLTFYDISCIHIHTYIHFYVILFFLERSY